MHTEQISLPATPTNDYDHDPHRRTFLRQTAGIVISGTALAAILAACESTTVSSTGIQATLDINAQAALQTVGNSISQTFGQNNGGRAVILIRSTTTDFIALSSVCTHEQCTVSKPQTAGGNIICSCHGAIFSPKDGSVLGGPAPSSLQRFQTAYDATTKVLTITF